MIVSLLMAASAQQPTAPPVEDTVERAQSLQSKLAEKERVWWDRFNESSPLIIRGALGPCVAEPRTDPLMPWSTCEVHPAESIRGSVKSGTKMWIRGGLTASGGMTSISNVQMVLGGSDVLIWARIEDGRLRPANEALSVVYNVDGAASSSPMAVDILHRTIVVDSVTGRLGSEEVTFEQVVERARGLR